jgi:pimeloyl-ACP methyl ester carboxylesterase
VARSLAKHGTQQLPDGQLQSDEASDRVDRARAMITMLLLPGMDGTGELFERFIAAAPPGFRLLPIRFPEKSSYDELETALIGNLPDGPFTIVAESFSGPLGIRLAARAPERVQSLILSNSCARAPRSPLYAALPWSMLFRFLPPKWVIRVFLLGRFTNSESLRAVRKAAAEISPRVMAQRIRETLRVDDLPVLRALRLPIPYLRGREDRLVFDRSVEEMQRANPAVLRRDLAAPHLLLQTVAEEAWSHIEAFIMTTTRKRG